MSYNSGWDHRDHDATYGAQGGLGALDIAALQALYGVNLRTATGKNLYSLPTQNGSGTGWSCIWDAGGVDTLSALHARQSVIIDLRPATVRDNDPHAGGYISSQSGVAGGFTIAKGVVIENAVGGIGNDRINGNAEANRLRGMKGNDTLHGYDGDDRLEGGAGRDVLVGGNGHDTFVFDTRPDKSNIDRIEDFHPGEDIIRLEDAIFTALTPGILAENLFRNGGRALDRTDHVLYDAKTGVLAYDPDGSGPKASIKIAILKSQLALHSSDFIVI
ncbi:M10 family metallopeptidase C-terminal domain-containing protein [Microvirga sp. WGZ8]|uniref:M10 family metallopeptidase C-terminal domain-containing protein n=2 Tax=Microvirga puerhi TaxID=2876078 RepID=A0ABS7VK86_9HYPH|nr:M10 family metallopeptidase C-terminal domain-containing protein [Microvirga puerhi]MBZ6075941.1 M10 family metallopeptidase C-terminal domain-containing protein [Microvirga puerhi]